MKICTITCHDVYNHGASLQAFALMKYLEDCGHDVEIIDYKPDYLSNHYNLLSINNPKWKKNVISKLVYLAVKIPQRLLSLKRKKLFDQFKNQYLKITKLKYTSNEELKKNIPTADAFICGSDQIWNSRHKNGRDPAFYLDFVPEEKLKASFAASFATETINEEMKPFVKMGVKRLNFVSVREKSGVGILKELGIQAVNVVDPVFLLDKNDWNLLAEKNFQDPFILVYDFDNSDLIKKMAMEIKKAKGYKIYALNRGKNKYADKYFDNEGPETFISLIKNAKFVISNSFHAAVYSIIYEKDFVIVNRKESINTRMRDLLEDLKLYHRLVDENYCLETILKNIEFKECKQKLNDKINFSKRYLYDVLDLEKKIGEKP